MVLSGCDAAAMLPATEPEAMDLTLCAIVLTKIDEQIERIDHLISLLPRGQLGWRPSTPDSFPAGVLLGHLLECLAGFCATLYAIEPDRLKHFSDLRKLPVNRHIDPSDARGRIRVYQSRIHEGFALLQDGRLSQLVPTVFVLDGEPLLTLLLGNLEHTINHKHQLFSYLQLMGVAVSTSDLYRLRGHDG